MCEQASSPLADDAETAPPPKQADIEKLLEAAPRYGVEIKKPHHVDDERTKIAYEFNVIRLYGKRDLDGLLAAWAAASEIAHPFLWKEFLASERDNFPNLYLPNAET